MLRIDGGAARVRSGEASWLCCDDAAQLGGQATEAGTCREWDAKWRDHLPRRL